MTNSTLVLAFLLLAVFGRGPLWAQSSKAGKVAEKSLSKSQLKEAKAIYNKYACNSCHGDNGKLTGDLTGAYLKYSDEQMESYIKDARAFNNLKMPVYRDVIAPADYSLLVAYIRNLGRQALNEKK